MNTLINIFQSNVRFSEMDPMNIVWHGSYIRYFEDGREAFGKEFGLGYMDIYAQGFSVPVVNIQCDYKSPLRYEDVFEIRTKFIPQRAAKIKFEYEIFNLTTNKVAAKGTSIQVFLENNSQELYITNPLFFEKWKEKYL